MKVALRIGISIRDYEDMTPHELNLSIEAYSFMREQSFNEKAMFTYIGAKLPLYKKFPTYDEVFGEKAKKKNRKKKTQSPDEMLKFIQDMQ